MKGTESVEEVVFNIIFNTFSFFLGKSSVFGVLFGSCKVNFLVLDVKIATKDYRFGLFKVFNVVKKEGIPKIMAKV